MHDAAFSLVSATLWRLSCAFQTLLQNFEIIDQSIVQTFFSSHEEPKDKEKLQ